MGEMADWYISQRLDYELSDNLSHESEISRDARENHKLSKDPLHYHSQFSCLEVKVTTEKAYLLTISIGGEPKDCWVANSLVRSIDIVQKTAKIHTKIMLDIHKKAGSRGSPQTEIEF